MRARIAQLIDQLRTGFWFLPSLMMFLAIVLALVLLRADQRFDPGIESALAWAYSGGPEGARSLLSTIAGSMITAASVTFSLASVALSIASQQYGSRVLRNFMRDRITQILLGTFVSTFVYSVLIVRSIRGSEFSGGFVPAISVTAAIAFSVVSLILLVYFVHHVSTSIQASHIVSVIAEELAQSIPALYPSASGEKIGHKVDLDGIRALGSCTVSQEASGYIQSVDLETLLDVATRNDVVIEVTIKPGDHTVSRTDLAVVWGHNAVSQEDVECIEKAFLLGGQRTPLQDIRYEFQQLTDVIIRALSPGINDPFTAINGIDALATATSQLARRPRAANVRMDAKGALRLIAPTPRVHEILRDTVGHVAMYGAADPFVMSSLQRVLNVVEPDLREPEECSTLAALRVELDRLQEAKRS